jgi:D-arabinose 1-dehydrogenase-like Zn-dependent alcohol dehydrogenase
MTLPGEEYRFAHPLTLGHEGAGVISGSAPAAPGVKEGTRSCIWRLGLRAL